MNPPYMKADDPELRAQAIKSGSNGVADAAAIDQYMTDRLTRNNDVGARTTTILIDHRFK